MEFKKTFCIIGGLGFVGSNIVNFLLDNGAKVIVIDNERTGFISNISPKNIINENLTIIKLDINNQGVNLSKIIEKADYVIHLATIGIIDSQLDFNDTFNVNVKSVVSLLELCSRFNKRLLYISSASVYGNQTIVPTPEDVVLNPLSVYGISKLTAEYYCLYYFYLYKTPVSIIRYSNVYGPKQRPNLTSSGVITQFIYSILANKTVNIYDTGIQTRDYTYISDVVDLTLKVLFNNNTIGDIFNCGTGIETTVLGLARKIFNILDVEPNINYLQKRHTDNIFRRALNCNKAFLKLDWIPQVSLNDGIEKTIEDIKQLKNGLKYWTTLRLDTRRLKTLKDNNGVSYGINTKIKAIKNKIGDIMINKRKLWSWEDFYDEETLFIFLRLI